MASKSSASTPFGAFGESFELMQKMWGGMSSLPPAGNLANMAARMPQQLPSMLAPTVDVGELDKRIADLRAVEQWLELNANMLRTTIQTLEVQRATIATLKGITGALLAPMIGAPESQPEKPLGTMPPEVQAGLAAAHAEPTTRVAESAPTTRRTRAKQATPSSTPSLAEDALNPAAWWHALQDQFSKVASAAGEATEPEPAPPRKAKRRRKR
jgi:hypothetical protein